MGRPRVKRLTINCRQCGKHKELTPQTKDAKFCDNTCYRSWVDENPVTFTCNKVEYPERLEEDEGPRPTFTHSFTDEIHLLPVTGKFPMFL